MLVSVTNHRNRNRWVRLAVVVWSMTACCEIFSAVATREDSKNSESAQAWIEQLGHPQYMVRSQAQIQLRQMGVAAFDELDVAMNHADPETAATARYLLREIEIPWLQEGDSPTIARIMNDYGQLSESQRRAAIVQVAQARDSGRIAVLCRIARYELSPLASRTAALGVMGLDRKGDSASSKAEVLAAELEGSRRPAAEWLRLYAEQLTTPELAIPKWQQIIEQESQTFQQGSKETSSGIVRGLLWNYLELNSDLGMDVEVRGAADQMLALEPDQFDDTFVELVDWFVDQKSWDDFDALVAKYEDEVEKTKHTLYVVADARAKQGKAKLSQQLAEQALAIDPSGEDGMGGRLRVLEASSLIERGRHDWAKQEIRRAIDQEKSMSLLTVYGRTLLSQVQFDLAEYRDAATTLAELDKAIQSSGQSRRLYNEILRDYQNQRPSAYLPDLKTLAARRNYYLACDYEQRKDWAKQREHLQAAIENDGTDADVLIAMYRLHGADEAWLAEVRKRIVRLSKQFDKEIESEPDDSVAYNQWAWLISNTEGDLEQALRHSKKSLELVPDAPEYLDTLGRCYFALGDLENAVKHQRRAVELEPHTLIMRRQLELFESTLAANHKKD